MSIIKDNRRYPRIDHLTSQQILRLDDSQNPHRNYVITKNMSACGLRFTTHEDLKPSSQFLIYLNDELIHDLVPEANNWFKLGDYYLARVAWVNQIKEGVYEVGASFLERKTCSHEEIDRFTELVNLDMLESLPEALLC